MGWAGQGPQTRTADDLVPKVAIGIGNRIFGLRDTCLRIDFLWRGLTVAVSVEVGCLCVHLPTHRKRWA